MPETSIARDAGGSIYSVLPQDKRGPKLDTPALCYEVLKNMGAWEVEQLEVLYLDGRHRLIQRRTVAIGAGNTVYVSPRDIFRHACRLNAVAIVVAHNHPSHDPMPSASDVDLTRRIRAAGDLLGVTMLDHMVIAAEGYYSFADNRLYR